jgi:hypothetical protein
MTSKTLSTCLLALSLTAATAAFAGTAPAASGSAQTKPAVKTTASSSKQTQHHRFLHRRATSKSTTNTKKKDGKGSK